MRTPIFKLDAFTTIASPPGLSAALGVIPVEVLIDSSNYWPSLSLFSPVLTVASEAAGISDSAGKDESMKVTTPFIDKAQRTASVLLLSMATICAGSYAQPPSRQTVNEAVSDASLVLPDALIGTWRPYSKNYQRFGDLQIGKEVLSWGFCQSVRYRVYKRTGDSYYIEHADASSCDYGTVGTKSLVLVLRDNDLEVSVCHARDEFDKPPTEKYCSWGILNKTSDEPPDASSRN